MKHSLNLVAGNLMLSHNRPTRPLRVAEFLPNKFPAAQSILAFACVPANPSSWAGINHITHSYFQTTATRNPAPKFSKSTNIMPSELHTARMRRWLLSSPPIEWASTQLKELFINSVRQGPVPQHIAFVMDGNRRFARKNHIETAEGHNMGFEALAKVHP
jgi:hypothetical protein